MKELYTSPEMKLLSFAPAERLASSNGVDFDLLLGGSNTTVISNGETDVNVDIMN